MAIPAEKSVLLPLLKVLADAGGELPMAQAIKQVEKFFPEVSETDKSQTLPSGTARRWPNRVQWTRMTLVEKGCIDRQSPRGIWRITEQGKEFLESGWPTWKPTYVDPARSESSRIARQKEAGQDSSGATVRRSVESEPIRPTRTAQSLHELLKDNLYRIGAILEHLPLKEYRESPYVYDVIWREFEDAPRASHVFEVQDRGNLIEALAKLQHARDIWGSKLFLIVTGEKDRQKLSRLVAPLLSGTFHRLARNLVILSQEDVQELHESLGKQEELLKHLLT